MRRKKTKKSSKFGRGTPHAHPRPGPGHLQLVNSDHLEELSLCLLLPQKLGQLRGDGEGHGGMLFHLDWISSQQVPQAIQVSQVFPQDLRGGKPSVTGTSVPAFFLAPEVRTFVHHTILPGHRSSFPSLAWECQTLAALSAHKRDWREVGSVVLGEDGCGEMGTGPRKMASGDGLHWAQRRRKGTKQGRDQWQGAWGDRVQTWNCEEKVGISTRFRGCSVREAS